jgi:cytoskeletal protein CcmA (bactofilin family)
MPNINDRIGSQNVIRVLSNASAPPSRLVNLTDVNSSLKAKDGLLLVWNASDEVFYMTDTIDSSTLTISGIVTFSNTAQSTSTTTGAVIVSGGVGVAKNLNVGGNLEVTGVSTFSSDLDINASVDVSNNLTVDGLTDLDELNVAGLSTFASDLDINASVDVSGTLGVSNKLTASSTFESVGVTTLASAGGITTTGGQLYVNTDLTVGQNIRVDGTSLFIGSATFRGGTIGIGDDTGDNINVGGEFVSDLNPNDDATYDLGIVGQRWRNARFSGLVTTTDLYAAGLSTFIGNVDINGGVDIDGDLEIDNLNVSGIATFAQDVEITGNLTVNGTQTVLNTNILEVEDINIGIASATPKLSDAALDGAGITIHGLAGDKTLTWDNSNSRLAFNTDVYAPNYYAGTFDGPNGIAYFDNSGKLTGAASTQSGVTTTNYILTTNASGLPVWTTTIDGGEY